MGHAGIFCALARCVDSTPCVHVVVAPPPSLPSLSHRRSERPPWVLTMRSGSLACVFGLMPPFRAWFAPCVTMACAYGCVYVLARLSSVCPGRWWVVAPVGPFGAVPPTRWPPAAAGEQGLHGTLAACLLVSTCPVPFPLLWTCLWRRPSRACFSVLLNKHSPKVCEAPESAMNGFGACGVPAEPHCSLLLCPPPCLLPCVPPCRERGRTSRCRLVALLYSPPPPTHTRTVLEQSRQVAVFFPAPLPLRTHTQRTGCSAVR